MRRSSQSTLAGSPGRVLRRLFLTLFLRGRSSRGINPSKAKAGAPASVGRRLALVLAFYALFGLIALSFLQQPVFAISTYLHAMTFVLVGMYVATSAGEVLFNKEEADILLHRPIEPGVLLRSRIAMLVQVSLWMAGAFNLTGFVVGAFSPDGAWWFPFVHAVSVAMVAIFTTSTVVVVYQLCLRWFGRERLDAFMTATQVIVSIAVVLGGQLVPQLMFRVEGTAFVSVNHWWTILLPPSWFAGIDDALAGSGAPRAWWLALAGLGVTVATVWVALVRLAGDYQAGLQSIAESTTRRPVRGRRRLIDRLVNAPPLRWWLRDSVSRASFRLVAAYLGRDRDVKLRVWPGMAPLLVMPIVALLPSADGEGRLGSLGVGFGVGYLSLAPMMALGMLEFSQQWQASDVFRLAPVAGPAALCAGARRAVLALIAAPMMVAYAMLVLLFGGSVADLALILPGLIAFPVFAMIPCLGGHAVPFSRSPDTYKAATRTFYLIGAMFAAVAIGIVAGLSSRGGWFREFLIGETVVACALYLAMGASVEKSRWPSID